MIFLLILAWLALGAWGSYIGRQYTVRHYGTGERRDLLFYVVMAIIFGPINLAVTALLFWKR